MAGLNHHGHEDMCLEDVIGVDLSLRPLEQLSQTLPSCRIEVRDMVWDDGTGEDQGLADVDMGPDDQCRSERGFSIIVGGVWVGTWEGQGVGGKGSGVSSRE